MRIKSNNGFTLIEIAVVMVIIGFLMAAFFRTLDVQMQQRKIDLTQERLNNNIKALSNFVTSADLNNDGTLEQRLPCPANFNLNSGDTNYGLEMCPPASVAAGSTWNGVQVAQRAGQRVFIGAYPFATAQTNGENATDGYNSKFVYAVTESLTTTGSVASGTPTGVIQVRLDKGGINNTAPFVLVSTGKNGQNSSGTGANGDEENIDGDAVFTAFAGHRTANNDSYYDDEVAFSLTESDSNFCISGIDVQEFSTPGTHTWTKPANLQYVLFEIYGADGGQGNWGYISWGRSAHIPNSSAGDLGSGGMAKKIYKSNEVGNSETVIVGAGGSGTGVFGVSPFRITASPVWYEEDNFYLAEGEDAEETRVKDVILSGGKGVTHNTSGCNGILCFIAGEDGTATGADFFTTIDSFNNNYSPALYDDSLTGGTSGGPETHVYSYKNGKGSDGYVLATSYTCD